MPETDPTRRALALLALLQSGREHSGPELARRLGVTTRTVRRDTDRLRELGYTVHTRPGPGSSYRLGAGTSVPPLLFDPDEITAVVAGLRLIEERLPDDDSASRALAKLEQVLPDRLRRRATAARESTEVLDGGPSGIDSRVVGLLADAAAEHGRVRFGYRDQYGTASTRLVDPYRNVLRGVRWYLVAYDADRADWRTFRLDRVTGVERVPGTFARPDPPDPIGQWFASDFGRTPVQAVRRRRRDGSDSDGGT